MSERDSEIATTASSPIMFWENIATSAEATPSAPMTNSSLVGRKIPRRYVIRKRASRNTIRLACSHQPEVSVGTPTTSWAYWIVNVHAHTWAATLKNWAATP